MKMDLECSFTLYNVFLHFLEQIDDGQEFFNIEIAVNSFHVIQNLLFNAWG